MINGIATCKIYPQRGIRQGDPISTYLYLICTEGFSRLIQSYCEIKQYQGYRASRGGLVITHLLCADDSFLFMGSRLLQTHKI